MNLFGSPINAELHMEEGQANSTLEDLKIVAGQIVKDVDEGEIEIIPFQDSLSVSPSKHFKLEAEVLIRISRDGNLDQPSGPREEQVLHAVIKKLDAFEDLRPTK